MKYEAHPMLIDYSHLSFEEKALMVTMIIITNISLLPMSVRFYRKGMIFESMVLGLSVFCSYLYHFTEVASQDLLMSQDQWHRLDNIFSITSMMLIIMLFTANSHRSVLKYLGLFGNIFIMENDPFDPRRTVIPTSIFLAICLFLAWQSKDKIRRSFKPLPLLISTVFGLCAIACFLKGINEKQDYLRTYHQFWHLMAGAAGYFIMKGTEDYSVEAAPGKWN